MSALYDKIKEDNPFRLKWAGKCGIGFELPSVVPNVPKTEELRSGCSCLTNLISMRKIGRGERIRTSDPLVPNQVLYQAEPLPDVLVNP